MPGLIPLLLKPLGTDSVGRNRVASIMQPPPRLHSRQASTGSIPTTRSRMSRRLSQPTLSALPILPYTPAEWRRALDEIKRLHHNRKFRACSTRCCEILDNSKGNIEPAYLIYLNFYAATSLEMCARSLHSPSPYRLTLLQRSRTHYEAASTLITRAEDSVASPAGSGLAVSSSSSSLHSPTSSVSSIAWTSDTASTSPTTSISSLEDLVAKVECQPPRKRMRKKVSFSLPTERTIDEEPFIRPDSPTLGFDEEYYTMSGRNSPASPEIEAKISSIPRPVRPPPPVPAKFSRPVSILKSIESGDLMRDRSVSRYREHLSALRSQVTTHASNVQDLLSPVATPQEPAFASLSPIVASKASMCEATRLEDRKARIERLRKSGWQRKRFDVQRYEDLRHAAMAELI